MINRQAFSTFPDRIQEVQTLCVLVSPSTFILIFCKLGSHLRLVNLWEWLTLWPLIGAFPHISHTLDTL
jgi:hypothetical protein